MIVNSPEHITKTNEMTGLSDRIWESTSHPTINDNTSWIQLKMLHTHVYMSAHFS